MNSISDSRLLIPLIEWRIALEVNWYWELPPTVILYKWLTYALTFASFEFVSRYISDSTLCLFHYKLRVGMNSDYLIKIFLKNQLGTFMLGMLREWSIIITILPYVHFTTHWDKRLRVSLKFSSRRNRYILSTHVLIESDSMRLKL